MIANPEESEVPGVGIMFAEYDLNYRIAVGLPIQDLNGNWINPDDPAYPASSGIGGWGDGGWGGGAGIPLDDEGVVYYSMWRTKENIGTIIPARWGQTGPPYNTYTKWNSVGCATAAVAIVMYHWGQPVNYKSAYWDWSEIRKHIGILNKPEIYKNAYPEIGAIYCELVRNQNLNPIDLGSNGLAVLPKNIPPTLTNLGYQSGGGNQNYNYATIKQGLQLGQPAIVLGFDSSKILGIHTGGHYWVVDAILCQERTKLTQRMPPFESTSEIEVREFVHVNWGWDGRKNGYFYPNKYDSEHPAQTNVQTRSSGDGYFRYDLSMNTGIRWRK